MLSNPNFVGKAPEKKINEVTEKRRIGDFQKADQVAKKLSEELGIPYEEVMKTLEKNTSYALVASKVDTEIGESIKKWAKEKNCTEFASDCELTNHDSFSFHKAMGFEESNRIIL